MCGRLPRGPLGPEAAVAETQLSFARRAAPLRRPQTLQFLQVAKRLEVGEGTGRGGLREDSASAPCPDPPCRSAAAQPPPLGPRPGLPHLSYLLSEALVGEGKEGPAAAEESSDSVLIENCQNCESGAESEGMTAVRTPHPIPLCSLTGG